MNSLLSLRGVSRSFVDGDVTVEALRDVDLDVAAGEFVALTGPSAAGKSTMLAILGGLDTDYEGSVSFDGQDLANFDAEDLATLRRHSVGFVFQEYNLLPTLSVLENIALPLELDGVSPRKAAADALDAARRAGLDLVADRFPHELSGGQRQRVAIARGIVGGRCAVLADEPTGALDTAASDDIFALLRQIAEDGVAVLVVTHEPRLAAMADRIVYLRDGRVESTTSTAPLLNLQPHELEDDPS